MSSISRRVLRLIVLLGLALGGATPASAETDTPRGIWVWINTVRAWTLTVQNLTNEPLSLVSNDVTTIPGQRPPFHGNTLDGEAAFPLPPYQNVTWKSNTATVTHPHPRWNGTLTVLPQGMDSKWAVTLNFREYWFWECAENGCSTSYGTWVYLTADVDNPDKHWQDPAPYNISCSYPVLYDKTYNVLTLSGTDLVASLYAPYVNLNAAPSVDITLVLRQRWPETKNTNNYQDQIAAPCLTYQENNGNWSQEEP